MSCAVCTNFCRQWQPEIRSWLGKHTALRVTLVRRLSAYPVQAWSETVTGVYKAEFPVPHRLLQLDIERCRLSAAPLCSPHHLIVPWHRRTFGRWVFSVACTTARDNSAPTVSKKQWRHISSSTGTHSVAKCAVWNLYSAFCKVSRFNLYSQRQQSSLQSAPRRHSFSIKWKMMTAASEQDCCFIKFINI